MQSVFMMLFFEGFRLGQFAGSTAFNSRSSVSRLGVQLAVSRCGCGISASAREWLWRSLTYWRWQPVFGAVTDHGRWDDETS